MGEGTIPPYYGIDSRDMLAFWQRAALQSEALPDSIHNIEAWVGLEGPAPARAAIDLALYDRIGRQEGKPLYQLLDLPQPKPIATSFTISIDTPERMAKMAAGIPAYQNLKVKLGGDGNDEARLAAIREARPDARLRVDANAGWSLDVARDYVRRLERYELEMIEQPLVRGAIDEMGLLQSRTAIPIVADESVQSLADVAHLADVGVSGVNIKLMKVGGLSPALRMIRTARERGLRVMLGCMVETSLGTTAMAHLMGLAEWVDLDAPMLIANDPFAGVQYGEGGRVIAPERPGIGVELKESDR